MSRKFYHLKDVKNLRVISDDEGGYMLQVVLNDGAEPSEPRSLLNDFISVSERGIGFPVMFGPNRTIVAAVDTPLNSLEDLVSFFESVYKRV
jgi:hypothetical protein